LDEDSLIDDTKDENVNEEEINMDNEDNLDDELSLIDESSMAKAIGEDIELPEEKEEEILENNVEVEEDSSKEIEQENKEVEIPKIEENQTNDEKKQTIASMLNLDLEALKNSGAKITITIEFDKE